MLTPEQQRRACLEVLIRRTWPDAVAQSRRIQGKLTAASDHEQIEEILRMTSEPRWSTLKEIVKVHEDSHKKQDTLKAHITAGEEKKASNTARVAVATKKIHALEAERKTLEENLLEWNNDLAEPTSKKPRTDTGTNGGTDGAGA